MAQVMVPAGGTPVDRVIAALTAAGCNPRGTPPKVTSRCPVTTAHKTGDKNPSLSVGESPSGNALIYCHAGCTAPQIAEALGLDLADLFPEKAPKVAEIGPAGRWRATYQYHDADGELLFEVVRFDGVNGKTFRQRRPTPSGRWEWNTNGVTKVLYHLPQVLRAVAAGETIIIVEGEKDAENVPWAFGVTATCNPNGAGKWDAIHTEALRGATRVVVIADDDRPGRLHAAAVLRALDGQVAEVIAVLPAEGCKDVTDHLKAGHGKDRLRPVTLAELDDVEDDEPEPPDESLALAHIVDWPPFWAADRVDEDWLAQPLIPRGRALALYAPAKAGKSSVVLAVGGALATGKPIFGRWPCQPVSVLYLDYEMTEADLRDRLSELGYGPDDDLTNLHYALLPSLPPLDTKEGAEAVAALAESVDAQLVIVDTFARAVQGKENDSDTVRDFYRHTGMALKRAGIAVLRTDHAGKDLERGQRGTSGKADDVDVVWQLARTDNGVTLKRTHSRISWIPETVNLNRRETDDGRIIWTVTDDAYPDGTKEVAELLDTLNVPLNASTRQAQKALTGADKGRRRALVVAAQRWRETVALSAFSVDNSVDNPREPPPEPPKTGFPEPGPEPQAKPQQEPPRNHPEPLSAPNGNRGGLSRSERDPQPVQATPDLSRDPIFGNPEEPLR